MIRAAALLACAQGEDGGIPADAAELAAAVEMLTSRRSCTMTSSTTPTCGAASPPSSACTAGARRSSGGDYLLAASLRLAAQVGDRERYLDLRLPDYVGASASGSWASTSITATSS